MTVQITFNVDNDAFDNGLGAFSANAMGDQVRIVADQIRGLDDHDRDAKIISVCKTIFDSNGNDIGRWCIKDEAYL